MTDNEERAKVFKEIYGVSRQVDILEQFEVEYNSCKNRNLGKVEKLFSKYSISIFYKYALNSVSNNLDKFKNVIIECGGKYESNALTFFTIEGVGMMKKKESRETKKVIRDNIRLGKNDMVDPQVVIDRIQALDKELREKSYTIGSNQKEDQVRAYRIVTMLGLATGRRFTELMKTFEMSKHGTKIMFTGLLKGNNEAIEGNIIALTYLEVKKYLKELRAFADTEGMTEGEVNSKYAKVFNNAMKRLNFVNVKYTRFLYSQAGGVLFNEEGESLEQTITRILGHREVFSASLSYAGKES